jgi:uncharacterized RDD family membrane protein YckC
MSTEPTPADGSEVPDLAPAVPALVATAPSGFWRRLAAFLIDCVVIGLIGMLVGLAAEDALSRMGGYERLVGFVLALAYFGLLNSQVGGGATLGKRVMGIRVRSTDGTFLSVPQAMARQAVFFVPFFLNNAPFDESVLMSFWGIVLSVLIFGGLLSILYLAIFNRRTRRSLHDLASGSWVVREGGLPALPVPPLWRGHTVVAALVVLLSAGAPLLANRVMNEDFFAGLLDLNRAVSAEPGVLNASSMAGVTYRSGGESTDYLSVTMFIDSRLTDDEKRARKIAQKIVEIYPEAKSKDFVSVTFVYGFNMVIASKWRQNSFSFTLEELE